ncbi:hypothetical protein [Aphanothece sacrum]|uniref:Transmembrane protein n=1 Tax=Aphanothece sacrum FPU1 TaxID=1920663 RepID=A0A401IGD5_APHSA|nr:hypothetical protein [Aphanothece sacrum]GBF80276.1 hypothetical protein AsFPU1_1677 [Aphanothece sacrum FPU1]GBF83681.1 hypothetical protein AsFPU3_0724 [Aphanothece sacrum FPU3]
MTTTTKRSIQSNPISNGLRSLVYLLNGRWHKPAMQIFMVVIAFHLLEHLVQAYQLWGLGWPRPKCLGLLGLGFPWLMKSEWLHYGHALFMLLGFAVFRPSFVGRARLWWDIGFGLQFYHHFEHALLLGQAIIHENLFDSPVPISIGQIWFPRLELHLFYNFMILVPMLIAMYYHRFPPYQSKNV